MQTCCILSKSIVHLFQDERKRDIVKTSFGSQLLGLVMMALLGSSLLVSPPERPSYSYGADLTSTGCAIEHSHAGAQVPANAFDDANGTNWQSSQSGSAVANVAWIGCDFGGSPKHIEQVTTRPGGAESFNVATVAVQYADTVCTSSGTWTTSAIITVPPVVAVHTFALPYVGSHQCWRLFAAVGTGSSTWVVTEIQMMEQDATATPTNTPTYTPTFVLSPTATTTLTPTNTLTPTLTLTPTNTLTPTPDLYSIFTVTSGPAVAVYRAASYGDMAVFLGLACLVGTIILVVVVLILARARRL